MNNEDILTWIIFWPDVCLEGQNDTMKSVTMCRVPSDDDNDCLDAVLIKAGTHTRGDKEKG
jgi:hypothetical protein